MRITSQSPLHAGTSSFPARALNVHLPGPPERVPAAAGTGCCRLTSFGLERDGRPQPEHQGDTSNGRNRDPAQISTDVMEIVHCGGGACSTISALMRAGCASAWPACRPGRACATCPLLDVSTQRRSDRSVCRARRGGRQRIFSASATAPPLRPAGLLRPIRAAPSPS